ncbi:MAG TPA: AAA family ATPase [Puia sp.]|nr:AAA family ATPase [Puia sp.]
MQALIENSIILIGQISTGKSTLAKRLSDEFCIPKASFGAYLLHYCELMAIPDHRRKDLQNLGHEMILKNPISFLNNVIEYSVKGKQQVIFEGVRHHAILKGITDLSSKIISIYIDATYEQRLTRYLNRDKSIDNYKTENDFITAANHPVESEVTSLKEKCSIIIQSSNSADEDFNKLKAYIGPMLVAL